MTILEMENTGEDTLNGIVLALVGPEQGCSKDADAPRTLRMYNLASLVSLAKWAISSKASNVGFRIGQGAHLSQGAHPLDLYKSNNTNPPQQSPAKRHKSQNSIARSIKQFIEPQSPPRSHNLDHLGQRPLSPIPPVLAPPDVPKSESSQDSQWEVVDIENIPLPWANDYVPFASPGSRLINQNILSYALWSDENRKGRGGQLLAVAIRSSILLYETPKGERAFHFVKDFYTPFQPRCVAFFLQNVQAPQEHSNRGHKRTDSMVSIRSGNGGSPRTSYVPSALQDYGNHLSLFVIFDKKAGWIRITDSAVGEIELFNDNASVSLSSQHGYPVHPGHLNVSRDTFKETISSPTSTVRRIRHSMEVLHLSSKWSAPISKCNLSFEPGISSQILFITRGKQTQIVPCPLPASYSSMPPLWTAHWKTPPSHVLGRTCDFEIEDDGIPFLQIIAFGEGGIEIQEVPVDLLIPGKGKGKGPALEHSCAHEDLGGPVGFLCTGGHWDHFVDASSTDPISRSYSNSSDTSMMSNTSYGSEEMVAKFKKKEGIYGWWCKDLQDWRVFWIGGTVSVDQNSDDSSV
ncbi:hypothetical protein AX15_007273 [Amanita polypyramis BW_CC]|nr:hypothetical protein AX15_007273 [Amanita polypyramis BW_CC]